MKSLHRTKALAAYEGARMALKNDMTYPAYMMLKESARGVLSYIVEDKLGKDISEKTKLARLLELMDENILEAYDIYTLYKLVDAENNGLEYILTMDIEVLKGIKKTIKNLIATFLNERV